MNIVGGCCGTTPEHMRADRGRGAKGWRRARCPRTPARPHFSGLEPFEIGPDTGFVMIGERTNVTGSARFRRLIEANDYQGAVDVALEQVRGGANMLDVNMDADLLDAEQAMTTFLNLIATEPEVARIPIMVDSSRWSAIEAGLEVRAGQGDRQLDQPQGGRGGVPRAGAHDPRLRRRRRRDGVRRGGAGGHGRAQGRDLRARLRAARRGRLPAGGHHLRPERPRRRDRDRGAQRLREGVHRGAAADQGALPRPRTSGGISNLSFSFRGNDVVREAMHSAFLYHAIQRRARHGDRQRRPARRLRGHPGRPARARRGRPLQPPARRDRAARRVRRDREGRRRRSASWISRGARRPSGSGSSTRSCTGSSTSSRRTPRRRARTRRGRST